MTNTDSAIRKASLVAGVGLFLMAILAAYGNFGILEKLVVENNPAATTANIQQSIGSFTAGIVSLLAVAVLDVIVALSLYRVTKPVNPTLAKTAAIIRVVYAAVFVVAISNLIVAANIISSDTGQISSVMERTNNFNDIWQAGLLLFALHLFILGYLAYKAVYMPKFLGVLLVIAGFGYLVDSVGHLFVPGYSLTVAGITFIGEVVLIFWLLIKGRKVTLR